MNDKIAAGSIFIDDSAHWPTPALLQCQPHSSGWAEVTNVRSTFGKDISDAGWTFFFMAGEIKTTVVGFDREKALSTALSRLIAKVKSQNCNCIEITHVTGDFFLQVPYVCVSAHTRHLQKGQTLAAQR